MLTSISPIDGRYEEKVKVLSPYFSEYGLQKYRIQIEIEYFIALCEIGIKPLSKLSSQEKILLRDIYKKFSVKDGEKIKQIEKITNHDVKAIEYFIKEKLAKTSLKKYLEFIHFGLTSQDINNTATPLLITDGMRNEVLPKIQKVIKMLSNLSYTWKDIPLLARTHGQPASPTTLGKEIAVFVSRLKKQYKKLDSFILSAKFSGATGNFNAHLVAYPKYNWYFFGKNFVEKILGLEYCEISTQIDSYDSLSEWCQILVRINTILIDLNRDIWQYISHEVFELKIISGEIGSSAMPHKVNPIDFENSEGNLGISTAVLQHFVEKLPISRLQRDLTDSTVLRNIGVPISHTYIALESLLKGLSKLEVRKDVLYTELENHWNVVAEAIQTILRREGYEKPYEALKKLTRGKEGLDKKTLHMFIDTLKIGDEIKKELKKITPHNYIGMASKLVDIVNKG